MSTTSLSYDVFVNDPPPQGGFLPNGEPTALGFFSAKVERYPDYLGRFVLWVSARALYGVRGHPEGNAAQITLASWL